MALTNEKLQQIIGQLQGLAPGEQQKKLQEIMQTLPEDERKELIQKLTGGQQGGQCPFCSMVEGKIETFTVYEDDICKAILDINPANKGHILLFPKTHYQFMPQMPDNEVGHLMKVANKLSAILFETLGAQGTNIFVANGGIAGQTAPHILINIIPRFEGDGIQLGWQPKKIDENEMKEVFAKISSKSSSIKIGKEQAVISEEITEVEDYDEPRIP